MGPGEGAGCKDVEIVVVVESVGADKRASPDQLYLQSTWSARCAHHGSRETVPELRRPISEPSKGARFPQGNASRGVEPLRLLCVSPSPTVTLSSMRHRDIVTLRQLARTHLTVSAPRANQADTDVFSVGECPGTQGPESFAIYSKPENEELQMVFHFHQ
jgi:hypothetical protein